MHKVKKTKGENVNILVSVLFLFIILSLFMIKPNQTLSRVYANGRRRFSSAHEQLSDPSFVKEKSKILKTFGVLERVRKGRALT